MLTADRTESAGPCGPSEDRVPDGGRAPLGPAGVSGAPFGRRSRSTLVLAVVGGVLTSGIMTVLLAVLVGPACDGGDPGPRASENEVWVPGNGSSVHTGSQGWAVGGQAPGATHEAAALRVFRALMVTAATTPPVTSVDITWWPPGGAREVQFSDAQPVNPAGPAPYRFADVAPQGDAQPVLTVSYLPPAPADPQVLVDTFTVTTPDGRSSARVYRETLAESAASGVGTWDAGAPSFPLGGSSDRDASASAALADYTWYGSEWWFYTHDRTLDMALCQQWVDLIQSAEFFLAARFPVLGGGSNPHDFGLPLVMLAGGDSAARIDLLDERQWPPTTVLSIPLELRPERFTFAESRLPEEAGERWLAFAGAASPRVTCPQGLSLSPGTWEFYSRAALDFGGVKTACNGCVLEVHPCWEGQSPPFLLQPLTGLLSWALDGESYQGDNVTCMGPWPIRLASSPVDPPYRLSGPGAASVHQPPQQVSFHHTLRSLSTTAVAVTLSTASVLGIDWRLYQGTDTQPNLSAPISGPVALAASGMLHFWAVADVPVTVTGQETVTITASSTSPAGSTWNTDLLWIGAWNPPPTPIPSTPSTYLLPSVAHLPGVPPTQWRTNVAVVNRGAAGANLTLTYYPYEKGGSAVVKTYALAPGATKEWQDILVELFGFASTAKVKGSVLVSSDVPVVVTSRTFNQTATGTYGQYYPAVTAGEALGAGDAGVVAQLKRTAAFRTNVGLLALTDAVVALTAYDETGVQVGGTVGKTLGAGRTWQADDFFGPSYADAGNQDLAYVVVEVSSGTMWAYGSVVDNATGDPTTMPVLLPSVAGPYLLPSVAHLPGVPPTQWRTNVAVVNRGTAGANLTLTYYPYEKGGSAVVKTYALAPGATKEWQDILVELFGFASTAKVKGSVLVSSDVPVVVTSRTFNQTATGTYGQYYPAVTAGEALGAGDAGVVAQLKRTAAFRTNVGLLALTDAVVALTAYNATGVQVGGTVGKTLSAGRTWQADDFFGPSYADAGNQDLAYVVVEVSSGTVWAYGSVVDNATGDPTTMPVTAL